METYTILQILGIAAGLAAVCISVLMVRRKVHARQVLLKHLTENAEFINELNAFERAHDGEQIRKEIERMNELIEAQLAFLDKSDRERIEASLYQSSPVGRVRFIEKLASDASQLQHAPS
jgi:hypothetical protein